MKRRLAARGWVIAINPSAGAEPGSRFPCARHRPSASVSCARCREHLPGFRRLAAEYVEGVRGGVGSVAGTSIAGTSYPVERRLPHMDEISLRVEQLRRFFVVGARKKSAPLVSAANRWRKIGDLRSKLADGIGQRLDHGRVATSMSIAGACPRATPRSNGRPETVRASARSSRARCPCRCRSVRGRDSPGHSSP